MKISSKIRSLKFVIYKFLGKFIPYFKKLLEMAFDKIKEDVRQLLIDILKEKFKGLINLVDLDCSLEIDKITKGQHVSYNSVSLKYDIELKYNTIKDIQLFINYNAGSITCEFDPKCPINSIVMNDLILLENQINSNLTLINYFENQLFVKMKKPQ